MTTTVRDSPVSMGASVADSEDGQKDMRNAQPRRTKSKIKNRVSKCKGRRVYANLELPKNLQDHKGQPYIKYVSNKIITSKYTLWTFLPKNLFEQFRRAANLYFLLMAILGLIPTFSSNSPILALLPLSTVVFFTACKDAVEDRNRHQIDEQFNSATCYHLQNFVNVNYPDHPKLPFWKRHFLEFKLIFDNLWKKQDSLNVVTVNKDDDDDDDDATPSESSNAINGPPVFKKVMWRNIRVGDFLFLRNGDAVPADAIILSTSESTGTCFVETKDLDGETNLKPRRCVQDTKNIRSAEDCAKSCFWVESEAPNSNLFSYNATLVIPEQDDDQAQVRNSFTAERDSATQNGLPKKNIPVDINNLLLRAHVIRNTEWVIAITTFTGVETKIMLNSGETPSKRSRIEKEMNKEVILNFLVLIVLALMCAIGSGVAIDIVKSYHGQSIVDDLDSNRDPIAYASFLTFWSGLIIFQNIIPISLYISIEFVKGFQAFFIYNDLNMWDEKTQSPCVPKSWNLSDDLGQIEYIFSDKTGTLTRNIMEFRQCSIGGKVYGRNGWGGKTDAEVGKEIIEEKNNIEDGQEDWEREETWRKYLEEMKKVFSPEYSSTNKNFLTFVDPEIYRDLRITSGEGSGGDGGDYGGDGDDEISAEFDVQNGRAHLITEFFTLLAVCHTVVVEETLDSEENTQASDKGDTPVIGKSESTSFVNLSQAEEEKNSDPDHSVLNLTVKKVKNSLKDIIPSFKGLNSVTNLMSLPESKDNHVAIDKTVAHNIIYKAESPDEAALVSAAKNLGFVFLSRTTDSMTVDIFGNKYKFEILNILEFNSTRKRMSVIARRPAELGGGIVLFCKGADNVIIERLAKGQDTLIERTSRDIVDFSNDGLRTLTLAYRVLSETEYATWSERFQVAATSLTDRSNKIDAISEEIEKDLILLGATAIEDKLQEGVPNSISSLREGGCKVWVLTGDKLETAVNIGFAAQLLTKEMTLHIVKGSKKAVVIKELSDIGTSLGTKAVNNGEQHAFIVDGAALVHLLDDETCRQQLLELSEVFHSVICCRVSPLQKALVVELVRRGKKSTTLAIGDGANDVSMIQAANVGVGISGQEGVQAAMAADYSISQFRYLNRLLLVHGHWDYMRISEMILNFFYKNVIWVFPVLWYQIYCEFSANIFYDYSFVQLYNMLFTVGPVIVLGATDQSVGSSYCLKYPSVYRLGIQQRRYSRKLFIIYFLDGIWQSLVIYFTFYFVYSISPNVKGNSGYEANETEFSTAVAITAILIANLFVGLNTYYWSWFVWVVEIGEFVFLFAYVLVYGVFEGTLHNVGTTLFGEGTFWFGMVFSIILAGLPRYVITFVKQWWFSDDLDIVRQIRKSDKLAKAALGKEQNAGTLPIIKVEMVQPDSDGSVSDNNV